MKTPRVASNTVDALLVFADIIDSSKFSSVLGFVEYAKRLTEFRHIFNTLGERYFPLPKDKTLDFSQVDARGDEGTVFCIARGKKEKRELIFRAIEFLYHLKGHLYLGFDSSEKAKPESPIRMELGAGIHCGTVAFATGITEDNRSEIAHIDGFAINKAKRVESASRAGNFSKILLSKEAARLLEGEPILLSRLNVGMKGIEERAELYEVKSGLFGGLKIEPANDQRVIDLARKFGDYPDRMDEAWLKPLTISILDIMMKKTMVVSLQEEYHNQQLKIAWSSSIEDDPILIYLRARHYQNQGKYTQQIRHLKSILDQHPEFVFAKKRMVEACWKIALQGSEPAEKVFARDVAEEFLTNFSHFLSSEEKKQFGDIIEASKQ